MNKHEAEYNENPLVYSTLTKNLIVTEVLINNDKITDKTHDNKEESINMN